MRQERLESLWKGVVGGLVLGSKEFAAKVLMPRGADTDSYPGVTYRALERRPEWAAMVRGGGGAQGLGARRGPVHGGATPGLSTGGGVSGRYRTEVSGGGAGGEAVWAEAGG